MAGFDCCINCKNREVGCHSICKEYISRCKENEKRKSIIRAKKDKKNKDFEDLQASIKRAKTCRRYAK